MICKGDGTLFIDPDGGDVKWASGALETWCRDNGYVDMMKIADYCGIDVPPQPELSCEDCPEFEECLKCCADDEKPDNSDCLVIDEDKCRDLIMGAIARLSEEDGELLGVRLP